MTLHKATNVHVIELDMHKLAKILLDITQNPAGRLLLLELCHVSRGTTISDGPSSMPASFLFNSVHPKTVKITLLLAIYHDGREAILMDEPGQRFTCTHMYVRPVQPFKQEGVCLLKDMMSTDSEWVCDVTLCLRWDNPARASHTRFFYVLP